MDILQTLRKINELDTVPDDQLNWLIEQSDELKLKQGEYLFKKGSPIDKMLIILEGHFVLKVEQAGNYRVVANFEGPTITGLLPYSRAKEAIGYSEASGSAHILQLHRDHFAHMKSNCDELTTALVHMMSSRIRSFTKQEQQNDKMMALGKLSAGLAHELNNPSSAVVRSAQTLNKHLRAIPEGFKNVIKIELEDEDVDAVNEILFNKVDAGIQQLSLMDKSGREDEIMDWLEDHEVEDADEIAENLVDYGFVEQDLDDISDLLREEDLSPVINWLNQVLTTERLVTEIEEASQRINDLVSSVKSYTHMDQAPERKETDIHVGIENTLTMLDHKLRKSNIEIVRNYQESLPQPMVLASALNQVWTNLIDNAIDAMKTSDTKVLTIDTKQSGQFINIDIKDSGSGIPDDVKDKIFDPFFTTKAVGEGTGLGLEVVHDIITKQHNGTVNVESAPGSTVFKICFPITQ